MSRSICSTVLGALVAASGIWPAALWAGQVGNPDFDGDGYGDVAVGAPYRDGLAGAVDAGALYVYSGSSAGPAFPVSLVVVSGEPNARIAWALKYGNFNGDAYDDLVIGSPYRDVPGCCSDAGIVGTYYGSSNGLASGGAQGLFSQNRSGIPDAAEAGDRFGFSLAVGDFDGDGFDDVAAGVPYEDVNGFVDSGAVNVIYGSVSGLTPTGSQFFHRFSPGVPQSLPASASDNLGAALAAGDFNGDGFDDLAIAIPNQDLSSAANIGTVLVIKGSPTGLNTSLGTGFLLQSFVVPGDSSESGDRFGASLAAGNFNGDPYDDLAVGVPFEDVGSIGDAGMANVIFGSSQGLAQGQSSQTWTQSSPGILEESESGDKFGAALTAGDFNGDGFHDLAVGVPREDDFGLADVGAVNVLYGAGIGLTSQGNQLFRQGTPPMTGSAETSDRFDSGFYVGDFNGDGRDDLAIGVPFEDFENQGFSNGGLVDLLYGSALGLSGGGNAQLPESPTGPGDRFGWGVGALF